jgi:hypothetical protein
VAGNLATKEIITSQTQERETAMAPKKKAQKRNTKLNSTERILLYLPAVAGLAFGLLPLLLGGAFGNAVGYSGDDTFIYRVAGAATLGYGVALIMGLRKGEWAPLRLVVLATLVFNLASIFACVIEIINGTTTLLSYVIFASSILFSAITAWVLNRHKSTSPKANVSKGTIQLLWLGTVLSAAFGLLPLLVPVQFSQLVGFRGTDVFLIRQAAAAALGYAVMGVYEIRSGVWAELRLPVIMAVVFNGFSFVASVLGLMAGDPVLIVGVIGAASLFITVTYWRMLGRTGK